MKHYIIIVISTKPIQIFSRKVKFMDCTIATFESNAISKSGINYLILINNK